MTIYVDINALCGGDGTAQYPFRSISEAARVAFPGDEVVVAPGIYREEVIPLRGGKDESHRITYRSAVRHAAVITGAEPLKDWIPYQGTTYIARVNNSLFGDYNPYTTAIHGDWYYGKELVHTGEVFLNGRAMYETQTLKDTLSPQPRENSWEPDFTKFTWYTEQDGEDTLLYANFHGIDPRKENVEIAVRRRCFFPRENGINYITLSGFTVCCAATQWAPPTAHQDGMIGPNWAKGWIIEECDISRSRCSGISLGKYLQPHNENKWTTKCCKHGTQTERDAVCKAVLDGWTRETVGSHIVRRCNIHDCGQAGIVGHMGGAFSLIEDNHIHHINNKQDLAGAEIGAIKMHAAIDVVFCRNHIHHSTRGIWLDWQAQGSRITQCLFHHNVPPLGVRAQGLSVGEDIFVEMSHGPTLIDRNLMLSEHSCRLSTQGIALAHNLIAGSFTYVGSGTDNWTERIPSPRYTPYHVPHQTGIAGFMSILHGDARFYNNIFVQQPLREDLLQDQGDSLHEENLICGMKPYDGYPTAEAYFAQFTPDTVNEKCDRYYDHLPIYAAGNVYCNGAQPWNQEISPIILKERVSLCLKEKEDGFFLETNLYELLPCQPVQLITSQLLGEAFEPEQRFELPDGSELSLDRDYFDAPCLMELTPGPFRRPDKTFQVIQLTKIV